MHVYIHVRSRTTSFLTRIKINSTKAKCLFNKRFICFIIDVHYKGWGGGVIFMILVRRDEWQDPIYPGSRGSLLWNQGRSYTRVSRDINSTETFECLYD